MILGQLKKIVVHNLRHGNCFTYKENGPLEHVYLCLEIDGSKNFFLLSTMEKDNDHNWYDEVYLRQISFNFV